MDKRGLGSWTGIYVSEHCFVDSNVLLSVSNGFITNSLQSGNNIVKER